MFKKNRKNATDENMVIKRKFKFLFTVVKPVPFWVCPLLKIRSLCRAFNLKVLCQELGLL